MIRPSNHPLRVVLATPPIYQAPLPLEVHLPMIPQGPAMLAAVLQQRGHHVACFDAYEKSCRQGYFDACDFTDFLQREQPAWLGLSVYSDGFPSALRMIELAKAVVPDCRVVVGGPHFTLFPDAVPVTVDAVVVGEGELALPALLDGLIENTAGTGGTMFFDIVLPADYVVPGSFDFDLADPTVHFPLGRRGQRVAVGVRRAVNGQTHIISMRDRLVNEVLGSLPYPAYDLFLGPNVSYQFDEPALGLDGPMLNLNTSRGCSYGCSFCSVEGVWGKSYRWFPTDWILGLAADLKVRYGLRSVFFREDEFIMRPRAPSAWRPGTASSDEVLALAKGLNALGLRWAIENRADAFGSPDHAERFFKHLASFGLAGVFVGVESASETVRNKILSKKLRTDSLREFFRWAREAGVRTVANVMYGVRRTVKGQVLTDTENDWANTDALLAELQPTRVDRYVYVGVPTSPLYRDHLMRQDYAMIDVNGYLYPRDFAETARQIYGEQVEMAIVPGRPNLRVGPSVLPGIPTATGTSQLSPEEACDTLHRLTGLPGVLDVIITPLGEPRGAIPASLEAATEVLEHLELGSLNSAKLSEILRCYRPSNHAAIRRLACGPTYLTGALRTPSGEVLLIALHLAHDTEDTNSLLMATNRAVSLVNSQLRDGFVSRFLEVLPDSRHAVAGNRHLRVVNL